MRRCRLLSSAALLAALGNLTGAVTYCMVAWELALGMGDTQACWPIHCAIKLLVRKLNAAVRSSATDDGMLLMGSSLRIAAHRSRCGRRFRMRSVQHGNAEQSVRLWRNGRAHGMSRHVTAWHGIRSKPNRSTCNVIIAPSNVF